MEIQMERLSSQSDQYVQTKAKGPLKYIIWLGVKDFTLKNMIDLLFLLLIPAMIGILAIILQKTEIDLTQKNRDNDLLINRLQRESDEQQTRALANETVFSNYIKHMADVILYNSLKVGNEQFMIIRAFTATVLRQLDLEKKRLVVQFLYDTTILQRGKTLFATNSPSDADKHLKGSVLDNVDLSGGLELVAVILRSVSLVNASFSYSNIQGSDFTNSILNGVSFLGAKLDGVRFIDTQLQNTDFTGASVQNIQLTRVNLSQSNITDEQINQALFIYNTILPNGVYARNKTFLNNGDAKQGINGWNITSGVIEVKDLYFMGKDNSTMSQRINTTNGRLYGSFESFQYCLSFLFHGQSNLIIQIIHLNQKLTSTRVVDIAEITSSSCNNLIQNSVEFCYWSSCENSDSGTDYMDLKFIFGYKNNTTDATHLIAVKDIEFTMTVE